jgi:DNA polymerase-3 subunit delta
VPEEKPWEKEKLLHEWVIDQLASEGRRIESSAVSLLVKQLGLDKSTIYQELEKLICYAGERKDIGMSDVAAVCISIPQENAWQLGEVIFRRDAAQALRMAKAVLLEAPSIIPFLRLLRSLFQTNYQVGCLLEQGKTAQDISVAFPQLRGGLLNKHIQQAQGYGLRRFKEGLLAIDETELMAKSSSGDPDWLVERLIFKLAVL